MSEPLPTWEGYAAPGSPEWLARRDFYLSDPGPEHWWWLSFIDPDREEGQQFLGICMVKATNNITACALAWDLGCNPGGQVAALEFPEGWAPKPEYAETLFEGDEATRLSKLEADELGTFEETQDE